MPVSTIRDLVQVGPWRGKLMPASFDGNLFHCESSSMENGRRIVTHEFPKKELPYSEDMGRRAIEFSVRGYCIQFPADVNVLYQRDYTIARDNLRSRLETGKPGSLQLPMFAPMMVVCSRYRLTEEERFGGYCVFDMSFVELGVSPFQPQVSSQQNLVAASQAMRQQVITDLAAAGFAGPGTPVSSGSNVPLPQPRPPGAG
jgi:prophage DNA circulation protein